MHQRLVAVRPFYDFLHTVTDDDVGSDPGGSFLGQLGLRSIRKNATGSSGSLEVINGLGHGTRVAVTVRWAPKCRAA